MKKREEQTLPSVTRPWNPFWDRFSLIEKEFNRMFDDPFFTDWMSLNNSRTGSMPKINVVEKEDRYVIEAAIPGLDNNDVNIEAFDNRIEISGNKVDNVDIGDNDKKYLFREISRRSFHRIVPFQKDIDVDKISATYEKGLLTIDVLKKEADKKVNKRKIEIK
jgi:HSP20 family molecular chaperone IbpA